MRKFFKRLLIVVGVLAALFIILDFYGRSGYNPQGNDQVSFNASDLKPGKNEVEYLCNGSKISALLFLPDSLEEDSKTPAIVLTPPNTGVKEQTAGLYAEKLSKKGFITLAFDPRGFGNSGSHPVLFDLKRQIEDVRSSIDFISSLQLVDKENLFNMGICVGAPISTYETAGDERIKAQVMISPVYLTEEDNILPVPMDVAFAVSGFAKLYYSISGNDLKLGPLV
ncbi:MAG: alpha/beta fold hydrolase, partial [Bacteroidetes bacterium]